MPKRIQRKRTKGWQMPENTIYVGRNTWWGNLLKLGETIYWRNQKFVGTTPEDCVAFYREWIVTQFTQEEIERGLRGKDLACWCPLTDEDGNPVPCHADILLELANTEE